MSKSTTMKKTAKSAPKTAKKPSVIKKDAVAKKPAAKPVYAKKQAVKPVAKKQKTVKKAASVKKPVIANKPETQDMSLPEGTALQQTGQRRPLIVFPK
jgi:hypothetical protein